MNEINAIPSRLKLTLSTQNSFFLKIIFITILWAISALDFNKSTYITLLGTNNLDSSLERGKK